MTLDLLTDAVRSDLAARHAEPHRRYRAEHVREVLIEIDRLSATPPTAVVLAAWFHDAVYDVGAPNGGSELASADLAVASLAGGAGADHALLAEVHRLVLLTAGHEVAPGDEAGALLVDADLWILSSPPDRYDRYAVDVRQEYAHVPDDAWTTGRGAVLQHFLDAADALYAFGPADDRAARRARAVANLTRERATLG